MIQKRTPLRRYIYLTNKLFPRLIVAMEEIVRFIERGIFGWSRYDCYAGDIYLANLMIGMLQWIKKNKWGVPQHFVEQAEKLKLTDKEEKRDAIDCAVDIYNKTLDEIVFGLEEYLKMMDYDLAIETHEDLMKLQKKSEKAEKEFKKSMLLLAEYFYTLGV